MDQINGWNIWTDYFAAVCFVPPDSVLLIPLSFVYLCMFKEVVFWLIFFVIMLCLDSDLVPSLTAGSYYMSRAPWFHGAPCALERIVLHVVRGLIEDLWFIDVEWKAMFACWMGWQWYGASSLGVCIHKCCLHTSFQTLSGDYLDSGVQMIWGEQFPSVLLICSTPVNCSLEKSCWIVVRKTVQSVGLITQVCTEICCRSMG